MIDDRRSKSARPETFPVCLFAEGDRVYFGRTLCEVLWTLTEGDIVVRQVMTGACVQVCPGLAVSTQRPPDRPEERVEASAHALDA